MGVTFDHLIRQWILLKASPRVEPEIDGLPKAANLLQAQRKVL